MDHPETVAERAELHPQRARKPWSPPRVILSEVRSRTETTTYTPGGKGEHYPDHVTPSGHTGS